MDIFNCFSAFFKNHLKRDTPSAKLKKSLDFAHQNIEGFASGGLIKHADLWFNLKGDPNFAFQLSDEVKKEILHACTAYKDDQGLIHLGKNFQFKHLEANDLAILFRILNSYYREEKANNKTTLFHAHVFDIQDHLFRLCLENPTAGMAALNTMIFLDDQNLNPVIKQMKELLHLENHAFQPIFHNLVSRTANKALKSLADAQIKISPQDKKDDKKPHPLKVLKMAVETPRNEVGGLGAVLKATSLAHTRMKLEKVRGIHPFYIHDKLNFDVKFKGVITHQFKGKMVKSTIYKDVATGDYLVQPDHHYNQLFDIGKPKDAYSNFKTSSSQDRNFYMASAAAVFAGTYSGKTGNKSIDIAQADADHVGGRAFALMASRIDHLRNQAGLRSIKRVYLTHMLTAGLGQQGFMGARTLRQIGGKTSPFQLFINYTKEGLKHAHKNIFVSKGVALDATHYSAKLNKGLREATLAQGGLEKVIGITNGINASMFDICNEKEYGEYALKSTFEQNKTGKVETTDYLSHQEKIKKDLFEAGIIADPHKPLFLFVGRYSSEKGIDMLPAMVEEVKKQGGQCVIMGLDVGNKHANKIIKELKLSSQKEAYHDCLKVYDERSDQMDFFQSKDGKMHQNVKKGWLIRAAATAVMVPSHAEACGLVPMEAHSTGAIVIAPFHQGLRDMCTPVEWPEVTNNQSLTLQNGANAICYANHQNSAKACEAIKKTFSSIKSLNRDQQNQYMRSTHHHALRTYDWVIKDEKGLPVKGAALEYSKTYHEIVHKNEANSEVETFEQAYQRIKKLQYLQSISLYLNTIEKYSDSYTRTLRNLLEEIEFNDKPEIVAGIADLIQKIYPNPSYNPLLKEIINSLNQLSDPETIRWHLQFLSALGSAKPLNAIKGLKNCLKIIQEDQDPKKASDHAIKREAFLRTVEEFAQQQGTSDDLIPAFINLVGVECGLVDSQYLEKAETVDLITAKHPEFSKPSCMELKKVFLSRYNDLYKQERPSSANLKNNLNYVRNNLSKFPGGG